MIKMINIGSYLGGILGITTGYYSKSLYTIVFKNENN